MRIANIARSHEAVLARLYGGTERVVVIRPTRCSGPATTLVLFASAEARTRATLVPNAEIRYFASIHIPSIRTGRHIPSMITSVRRAHYFDIFDLHVVLLHLPFSKRCRTQPETLWLLGPEGLLMLYRRWDQYRLPSGMTKGTLARLSGIASSTMDFW